MLFQGRFQQTKRKIASHTNRHSDGQTDKHTEKTKENDLAQEKTFVLSIERWLDADLSKFRFNIHVQ